MDFYYSATLIMLVSIAVLGLITIPFGNQPLIGQISFATLSALIWEGYSKALYARIPMAALVIIGNSLATPHINLMITFSKPLKMQLF